MKGELGPLEASHVVRVNFAWFVSAAVLLFWPLLGDTAYPLASANVQFASKGDKCLDWVTFAAGKVTARGGRAVLVGLVPSSASPPDLTRVYVVPEFKNSFSVWLNSTKAGVHNRWEVRYTRDATLQIGAFVLGESATIPEWHVSIPLSLIALDEPPAGVHTYSAQIRFVGDRADSDTAQIRVEHARIIAVGL